MYFILQDLLEFPILKIEIEDDNPRHRQTERSVYYDGILFEKEK